MKRIIFLLLVLCLYAAPVAAITCSYEPMTGLLLCTASTAGGGGSGDVVGPASATADAFAQFNGTTGKLLKDSAKAIPTGTVVGTSDTQTLTAKTLTTPIIGAYTVAGLPAAGTAHRVAIVTDAATAGDCDTGGGSARAWCRDTGAAWEALGDGGAPAAGAANALQCSDGAGVFIECPPGTYAADVASADPWTILGTTHDLASCDVSVTAQTEAAGVRTWVIPLNWTCDEATFDIAVDWSSATAGRVVINKAGGGGAGGGGSLNNVVEDTTPQLGGNLDLNGFFITGLVIGTNVQAWDADLDTIAGLAKTDDNMMIANGTAWQLKAIPDCTDTGGNHLNYTAATNALSCGTSGGAGGSAPADAPYWLSTSNGSLSAEVNLGALADNNVLAIDVSAGTATPRAALYTDVVPLWAAGACSGYLKSDGTCDTPSGTFPAATAYQVYRRNSDDTADEAATITGGTGVTVTPSSGVITVSLDGTSAALLASNNGFLGNNSYAGTTTQTPSSTQTLVAGDAITVSTITFKSISAASGITLTSTPTIADGNPGQELILVNEGATNSITIQDETALAGSNLCLPADTNITLASGDSIRMVFSSNRSCWSAHR